VPLAPHFMMELSRQLLCCLPNAHILENIDGGSLTDLGARAEPIRIEHGWFTPPDRPGHGIIFDRAALAARASSPDHRESVGIGRRNGIPQRLSDTFSGVAL
jgi:L-alanine-DL-glutamate epimerase-like enolase superfamily enzyme